MVRTRWKKWGKPMTAALTVIHTPVPETFDYSAIDADVVANLRRQADRIKKRISKATQDLIDIGRDLLAAKRQILDHGEFVKWVEAEVRIARRTAQAYMAIARLADDKGAAIALLPPTTVHRLAAKSAPPEVVSEVVAKARSGDVLPDRTVFEMISEAKLQKRQTTLQEKSAPCLPKQSGKAREQAGQNVEVTRQSRETQTSEAADVLFAALSLEGVELVVRVFSEEERPRDLISVLRKRIAVAAAGVKAGRHEVARRL
jgi:hypothetical protein